ncbi:MAG TPA: molecular chaperone TorD family protein [Actinomycetota bacterium]|nr:molecular chaperone TorD family protein [Actinomycetota bacterium]
MTPAAPVELAGARRVAYRTLAACFLEPSPARLATLRTAVPELRERARPLSELAPGPAWEALLRALEGLEEAAAERVAEEHATLFLAGVRGGACPPHASAYLIRTGYEGAGVVAAVAAAYRGAGYLVEGSELPDHLAVELDFLGELCRREAEGGPAAEGWRERELSFLRGHLLRWLPRFVERLARVSPAGFYRWPAEAALALAGHDEVLLSSLGAGKGVA